MDKQNFLAPIIERARRNQVVDPEDYIGDDGLLVCGKCNTPKEKILHINEDDIKVPVMCRCREEEVKREEEERRRREEMERSKKLRSNSLMDGKFWESTFDAFRCTKHNARNLKLCQRYATGFDEMIAKNQGLLFTGDVGTGKTYAAACIANYLLDRCVPVVMTSFVKILEQAQNFRGDEEERYIRRMNSAKLLVIDDLGAERSTDFALEKVYNIIDSRYRASLPMILTTNLTLKEMKEATDIRYSRIYDRIFEACYPMEFTGPSWRKVEASRRFEEMRQFLEGP